MVTKEHCEVFWCFFTRNKSAIVYHEDEDQDVRPHVFQFRSVPFILAESLFSVLPSLTHRIVISSCLVKRALYPEILQSCGSFRFL